MEKLKVLFGGIPVVLTNDANGRRIGRNDIWRCKGNEKLCVITLGTGLGSGFVLDGEVLYRKWTVCRRIWSHHYIRGGRKCGCGRRGCLETYVSAPGIKRTAFELLTIEKYPKPLFVQSALRSYYLNKFVKQQKKVMLLPFSI